MALQPFEFRELMDHWDSFYTNVLDEEDRLEKLHNNNEITFYFKKDNKFYAGPENSRLAFARMKSKEPEDKEWSKNANFLAIDLGTAAKTGEVKESIFNPKDSKSIEIVDKDEAFKAVRNK